VAAGLAAKAIVRLKAVHTEATEQRGFQAVSSKDGFKAMIRHGRTNKEEMNTKTKLISATLFAAIAATPAMAYTDWKAVAAFDAVIAAHAADTGTSDQLREQATQLVLNEVRDDKARAIADSCQENAQ
jgi:hypothetical protein